MGDDDDVDRSSDVQAAAVAVVEEEDERIRQSRSVLQTLVPLTGEIQPFKSKWKPITRMLDQLPLLLTDLSAFPSSSGETYLRSELLDSVVRTLEETLALANRCSDSSRVSAGKLRMQSEIDAVSMKLGSHIQDCELLIKSGVLREPPPPPPKSRPATSRREAVRHEARTLLARLRIGDSSSKIAALDSLMSLIGEEDKNVLIAVAQGAIPVLVRLLYPGSLSELREKASAAIARFSQVESCRHTLVAEGALTNLIRILESGTGTSKEKACLILETLSLKSDNARIIGTRSSVSALIEICQIGTPTAQALAAGVLCNVAEVRKDMVEEGDRIFPVLVTLINSGTPAARENAAKCLVNLTKADEGFKFFVIREGGVQLLRSFFDRASTTQSQEIAVHLLRCFLRQVPLIPTGFIPRLVDSLSSSATSVRTEAALLVSDSIELDSSLAKVFGEANCIPPLVRMLDAKVASEKEAGIRSLSILVSTSGNRALLRKEEKCIPGIVPILDDPAIKDIEKKYAISTLTALSKNPKSRKKMVDSGALVYLGKLASDEVGGARKLLECLTRGNKFISAFITRT